MQGQKTEKYCLYAKCAVCNTKKLNFFKQQEVSGLLSSLEIKTLLSKTPSRSSFVLMVLNNLIQGIKWMK